MAKFTDTNEGVDLLKLFDTDFKACIGHIVKNLNLSALQLIAVSKKKFELLDVLMESGEGFANETHLKRLELENIKCARFLAIEIPVNLFPQYQIEVEDKPGSVESNEELPPHAKMTSDSESSSSTAVEDATSQPKEYDPYKCSQENIGKYAEEFECTSSMLKVIFDLIYESGVMVPPQVHVHSVFYEGKLLNHGKVPYFLR